jgi:hypothetical protein
MKKREMTTDEALLMGLDIVVEMGRQVVGQMCQEKKPKRQITKMMRLLAKLANQRDSLRAKVEDVQPKDHR